LGNSQGRAAVRWDSGGTAATELGNLGTAADGSPWSEAYAVNDAGMAVGYSRKYASGISGESRAVVWLPDGTVIDLNDLGVVFIPSGGTWTLTSAKALSANGWIAGESSNGLWVGQLGLGGSWLNTTGAGNAWGKGANWSTGTPAIQRDAEFDRAAVYSVAFEDDQVARAAHVTAGSVTFALGGYSLTLWDRLVVSGGARLAADGTIVGAVSIAGRLAPGNSPGTLTVDGDLESTGVLEFEINGTAADRFDRLLVSGEADLGGSLRIILGYTPAAGDRFDLMDWGDLADSGYSFDLSLAALPSGLSWDTAAFGADGTISVVPEPATLSLLALGVLALAVRRRRR